VFRPTRSRKKIHQLDGVENAVVAAKEDDVPGIVSLVAYVQSGARSRQHLRRSIKTRSSGAAAYWFRVSFMCGRSFPSTRTERSTRAPFSNTGRLNGKYNMNEGEWVLRRYHTVIRDMVRDTLKRDAFADDEDISDAGPRLSRSSISNYGRGAPDLRARHIA